MPGVAPPQAPQGQPQGGPPPGPGAQPQQGPTPEKIVAMVGQGLGMLSKMFASAGGSISDQEKKQLSDITNSFQALVQSLQNDSQQQQPPQGGGAPIPQNAAPGGASQPSKMTG